MAWIEQGESYRSPGYPEQVLGRGAWTRLQNKLIAKREWLERNPRAQYFAFLSKMPQPQQRYYSRQFGDIYGEYLGSQAQQPARLGVPRPGFGGFLSNINFLQRYQGLPRSERGFFPSRLTGGASRFLYY